jgi:hypothetical protein
MALKGRVILHKLIAPQAANKFNAFTVNRKFIPLFSKAFHWSLFSAR